jgi:OOP family OmpA-OmpF porin
MNKPVLRAIVAAGAVMAALVGMTGCGSSPIAKSVDPSTQTPAALAIVTGDANSPRAVLTPSIEALIVGAFRKSATLALIDAGGRPRLYSVGLGGDFGNADAYEAAETEQISEVTQALGRVVPAEGQSDPWSAVTEAVGWLNGQGGGTLVIENSGLGTAGFLDYQEPGLLAADPDNLVSFAREHHELPNATGLHAVLTGVGWTAPPQPALGSPERANLVDQWTALLKASGATVRVDETPLTGPGPSGAPPVSVVHASEVAWTAPPGTCGTALNSTELHFVVGTAQLVDPDTAMSALRQVVTDLQGNHQVATITGTTSSEGGNEVNLPLSRQRAQVAAQLMESMGLSSSQIGSVVGLGSHFSGYVPDIGPDGTLLPGPAAENRQVIITWPCQS